MARTNSDQLHGTLDMLVLKVLAGGPAHGYGIATRLDVLSCEVLQVEEGSLALPGPVPHGATRLDYVGMGGHRQ